MARISTVPAGKAGLFGRFVYWFSRRRFGKVMEPLTVMAHHPGLLKGYTVSEMMLDRLDRVDERLKALAQIKVAAIVGCEFCIDIGSGLGREEGVTEQQLRDLARYDESDAFSSLEKRVLDYAVAMTRTPAVISDELFDALREHLDEPQLVELTAMIAQENLRARFNHAFGIAPQGFSAGAYCPAPELPLQPAAGSTAPGRDAA